MLATALIPRLPGIHLTLSEVATAPGKEGEKPEEVMIARSISNSACAAPMNDLLGLVICEGIETGLSYLEATGLGVWVAGSDTRMPALAEVVPGWADCVCIDDEGNPKSWKPVRHLAGMLTERGIHVEIVALRQREKSAA